MEPEGLSSSSLEPAAGPYPKQYDSPNTPLYPLFLRYILIFSYLCHLFPWLSD